MGPVLCNGSGYSTLLQLKDDPQGALAFLNALVYETLGISFVALQSPFCQLIQDYLNGSARKIPG
jgi:hypothetical protein